MRFAKTRSQTQEDTRKVKTQTTAQTVEVRADGEGLVSHAGAFLLAHRVIKSIGADLLEAIRAARAKALAKAWDAGARPKELILDIDASLLTARSEKERATGTYKGGFGFHPLLCYLAETGEPLAAVLRPGNAGANTASDHFEVLQLALEQLPEADIQREILVRTDIGGRTHAFTQDCCDAGIRFSVGYEVDERVREAIGELPEAAWQSAIDGEGKVREGARVAELADRVDLSGWPEGTRLIVRRERPHPGAQLSVFDCETGHRHTAFITDQADEDIAALELGHRRRAKVEDAIRVAKETGMRRMPFAAFEHNAAWLDISLAAQALLRWAALLCLKGELALAEPKRVRQRLLHVAGRLVRSGRRVALRLPRSWPWAEALVAAFARLRALPTAAAPHCGRSTLRPLHSPCCRPPRPSANPPPQGGFGLRRMLREGETRGKSTAQNCPGAVA